MKLCIRNVGKFAGQPRTSKLVVTESSLKPQAGIDVNCLVSSEPSFGVT